ncbi:replication-relaxation family protein [Nocardiopsis salina]|uniref:replication-relaxation family protein n=1 Tax=Nocardiopsis salina TaxID=245836 RepID=UPI00034C3EE6|nr:replication-relaxation family protein [Nocardiopsis salina]
MSTHGEAEPRPVLSDYAGKLLWLARRVTPRDQRLLCDLYDHNVMTTHHLHRVHFPRAEARRARRRLHLLHQYGLITGFRPHGRLRAPVHWILAPLGAALVAEHRGLEPEELNFRQDRALARAHSGQLGHMVGLVECFALTTEAARVVPTAHLVRWETERDCARRWGRFIRPDAYMRWHQGTSELDAFWEYDTGTEPLTKVQRKMAGYARLARESGLPSIVLFALHSEAREEHLVARLATDRTPTVGVYMTTHARLRDQGPAEQVWHTDCAEQLTLVDIARRHHVPEPGDA